MELKRATEMQRKWVRTMLPNASVILDAKASDVSGWIVVLCLWRKEWIVWNLCEKTRELQSGRYYQTKKDAMKAYSEAR